MELDKTTLYDLAVFANEEEFSVFGKLNEAITSSGRDEFKKMLYTPLKSVSAITDIQLTLKQIGEKESGWTKLISNGTIMVVERYFHATIDEIPAYGTMAQVENFEVFNLGILADHFKAIPKRAAVGPVVTKNKLLI